MQRKESFISLTQLGVAGIFICGFTCCAATTLPKPMSDYFILISVAAMFAAIWDARIPVFGNYTRKGIIVRLVKDDE